MIDEFDTTDTDYPICPYCGHIFSHDYFEMNDGEQDCPKCDKKFNLESETLTKYTTKRLPNGRSINEKL